jgi:hypothetical protein
VERRWSPSRTSGAGDLDIPLAFLTLLPRVRGLS